MTHYAGLDVSQKETTICIVDEQGRRLWRGTAPTDPEAITEILHRHGCDLQVGVETGPMMGQAQDLFLIIRRHYKPKTAFPWEPWLCARF